MQAQSFIMDSAEHWNDRFAREHDIDDYYHNSGFLIRAIEQRRLTCIREMVAASPTDHILEVGCGGGHVLQLFPQSELTGVDVSGEMLRKARRNLEGYRARLLKGELHELELPSESFDKIVCSEVLEHAVDPVGILQQIQRLMKPCGQTVITFPNDRLVNRMKTLIRHSRLTFLPPLRRISWGGDQYHLHTWSISEMRELLSRYWQITREEFAPNRFLPIRCCFQCETLG